MSSKIKCKNCWEYFLKEKAINLCWVNFCKVNCSTEFLKNKRKVEKEKKLKQLAKVKEKKLKAKTKKQNSISFLMKKADNIFSKYIRLRDCLKTTNTKTKLKCFTCDDLIEIEKANNMHFISRWVKQFRFDESNCRWGCMKCNVILNWNYIEYFIRLEKELGRSKLDEMISKKNELCKVTNFELQNIIAIYSDKLDKLNKLW